MPLRKYPRANFHDYNGGLYFVTACTKEKNHYFGEIRNGIIHFTALGKELENNLLEIDKHYDDVEVPLFVVMPNHFHAIIHIVGSRPAATASNQGRLNQTARIAVATGRDPTVITHHNSRLSTVVGGIKAHVTRFARNNSIEFAWQPRYHDHIIRGNNDCNNIANYIENNVAKWDSDCYNRL